MKRFPISRAGLIYQYGSEDKAMAAKKERIYLFDRAVVSLVLSDLSAYNKLINNMYAVLTKELGSKLSHDERVILSDSAGKDKWLLQNRKFPLSSLYGSVNLVLDKETGAYYALTNAPQSSLALQANRGLCCLSHGATCSSYNPNPVFNLDCAHDTLKGLYDLVAEFSEVVGELRNKLVLEAMGIDTSLPAVWGGATGQSIVGDQGRVRASFTEPHKMAMVRTARETEVLLRDAYPLSVSLTWPHKEDLTVCDPVSTYQLGGGVFMGQNTIKPDALFVPPKEWLAETMETSL